MKIWILKRKGANKWYNLELSHEITYGDKGGWAQLCFVRKCDASEYLKSKNWINKESWEVIGCAIPESDQDNRFNSGSKRHVEI